MITHHEHDGTHVLAGKHCLAIITTETPAYAVVKFIALCEQNADELTKIGAEYEDCRAWNIANRGKGRNWPVFSKRDKLVNRLLKEAGIVDT